MKKYYKIAASAVLALSLLGCSTQQVSEEATDTVKDAVVVKDGEIIPTMPDSELRSLLSDEVVEAVESIYGDVGYGMGAIPYIGSDMPDYEFGTYNGGKVNTKDFEGKPYIVEVAATWCSYCQETSKDHLEGILEVNPDYGFIQTFADGSKDDVTTFYETIGKDASSLDYVVPSSDVVNQMSTSFNLDAYPSFIFVDAEGKIAWIHTGLLTKESFDSVNKYVTGEERIYNMHSDDFDADNSNRAKINPTMVASALNDEANKIIASLEIEDGGYTLYSNLNRTMNEFKLLDINGVEVNNNTFQDKDYILDFVFATNECEACIADVKSISAIDKGDTEIVLVLIQYDDTDPSEFAKSLDIDLSGITVIPFGPNNYDETIYDLDLFTSPTQFYINRESNVAGATTGVLTKEKLESAYKVFFGEVPLYKMVK